MAINRKEIIKSMSAVDLLPNENGVIDAFGVLVNQLPTSFWNAFPDRLLAQTDSDLLEANEYLLYNAAHECGYHTGYGIITSEEWKAVVEPMIENAPEDVLYGAFAVFTAWGWGDAEIVELVPGEKMVVRVYDYYESDVVAYGERSRPCGFMIRGVCAAFMELAFSGEYDPSGSAVGTFECKQTSGIECGDSYGEFVVTKALQ